MPVKWFIRINTSGESKLLRTINISYNGLIINFRTALFFHKLRYSDIIMNAPTIAIDPDLTFATCIAPRDKKTVEYLFDMFELTRREPRWSEHPLDVSTLNEEEIRRIAERMLIFQRDFALASPNTNVLEFFGISTESRPRNYMLLAPYLVITSVDGPEYEVNKKLLEYSIQTKSNGEELYAVIALDKALLGDIEALKRIISDYSKYSDRIEGYFIWVTDFDETEEDFDSLIIFTEFLYNLKKLSRKPIINLYGGYFSLMLSKLSIIDGIVTKICYRQRRTRCVIGGGPSIELYYFPLVKTKVDIRTVASIIKNDKTLKCECPICSKGFEEIVRKELTKPRSAINELKKHFLYAFDSEVKKVSEYPLDNILNELKQNYEKAEKYIQLLGQIDHLMVWYNVFVKLFDEIKTHKNGLDS